MRPFAGGGSAGGVGFATLRDYMPGRALGFATRVIGSKRLTLPIPMYTKEDVAHVKQLVEEGKYRPVIDRTYRLEQVVEATRYVETGQKTGNVVLTVGGAAAEGES